MAEYDRDNVFAKILRGDMPAHKIYEDDAVIAIMDAMPQADGHVLVIPKKAGRTLLDTDVADLQAAIATVQKVGRAVKDGMKADGLTIQQFNERAGGQEGNG